MMEILDHAFNIAVNVTNNESPASMVRPIIPEISKNKTW